MLNLIAKTRQETTFYQQLPDPIREALADPDTIEISANPNGSVYVERQGTGRECLARTLSGGERERIIRLLADFNGQLITKESPFVSGTLPSGDRVQAIGAPIAVQPTFSIRKRAERIYTLDDYIAEGVLSASYARQLRVAIGGGDNIIIVGATASGKTTLLNACCAEPAIQASRLVLLQDTDELQASGPDQVSLFTHEQRPRVTMRDLVKATLRLAPQRIVVGEVRDGASALELLKAWNTGHPGGLSTLHANSPRAALRRLEELIGEVSRRIPKKTIAEAVNLLVFIQRTGNGYRVTAMEQVVGLKGANYQLETLA